MMMIRRLVLLVCLTFGLCYAGGFNKKTGGFTPERPVTESDKAVRDAVEAVKTEFAEKSGVTKLSVYKPIAYRLQVVAGTNYLVKVQLVDLSNNKPSSFAHLRIFVPLPNTQEPAQLVGYQLNKLETDPIDIIYDPAASSARQLLGGADEPQPANQDVKNMIHQVKADYIRTFAASPTEFVAISYRQQVVAGTNYFVKVRVDGDDYVHLRIFMPLPTQGSSPLLVGVQRNKKLVDSIDFFESNIPTTTTDSNAGRCSIVTFSTALFIFFSAFFATAAAAAMF